MSLNELVFKKLNIFLRSIAINFWAIRSNRRLSYLGTFSRLSLLSVVCATTLPYAIAGEKPVFKSTLSYEDNGKSIESLVGNELIVRLEESPTTGYMWINKTIGEVLTLKNTEFSATLVGMVGGTGWRTLSFLVSKTGTSTLLLKQMREWEGESSVIKELSVTIHAVSQ